MLSNMSLYNLSFNTHTNTVFKFKASKLTEQNLQWLQILRYGVVKLITPNFNISNTIVLLHLHCFPSFIIEKKIIFNSYCKYSKFHRVLRVRLFESRDSHDKRNFL